MMFKTNQKSSHFILNSTKSLLRMSHLKRKTRQLYPTVTMLLLYPAEEGLCVGGGETMSRQHRHPQAVVSTSRLFGTGLSLEFVLIVMIDTKNKNFIALKQNLKVVQ